MSKIDEVWNIVKGLEEENKQLKESLKKKRLQFEAKCIEVDSLREEITQLEEKCKWYKGRWDIDNEALKYQKADIRKKLEEIFEGEVISVGLLKKQIKLIKSLKEDK